MKQGYKLLASKKLQAILKDRNIIPTEIKYTGIMGYHYFGIDFYYSNNYAENFRIELEPLNMTSSKFVLRVYLKDKRFGSDYYYSYYTSDYFKDLKELLEHLKGLLSKG